MPLGLEQTGEETSQEVPKSNQQALEVWEETQQQCCSDCLLCLLLRKGSYLSSASRAGPSASMLVFFDSAEDIILSQVD